MFHDKGIGLSFLLLAGKSDNQEQLLQGQVSGCPVPAAAALLPSCSCKCPHLQGMQKSVLGLLASTNCLNYSSLSSWGKRTWAKEVGDVDLRHEPDTDGQKAPSTTLFNGNKISSVPSQNPNHWQRSSVALEQSRLQLHCKVQRMKKKLQLKRRIKHSHFLSHRLHPCNQFGEDLSVLPCISTIYQLCFSTS